MWLNDSALTLIHFKFDLINEGDDTGAEGGFQNCL